MITSSILQAAVLYLGFLAILLWRLCFPWQVGRTWKKAFNHFTLLYTLVSALYIFELVMFIITAHKDYTASAEYSTALRNGIHNETVPVVMVDGHREWPIYWLRFLVLCVPVFVAVTIFLAAMQSRLHLREIVQDSAQMQHDRVMFILAMPAVYAVVVMSGIARVYETVVDELIMQKGDKPWPHWDEAKATSFAEYETCVYVGDLYEAWALYQFGKLTIELLQNAFPDTPEEELGNATPSSRGPSQGVSIHAMSQVLWVGTGLFIIVNLVQTGWALYMWFFSDPTQNWAMFEYGLSRFSYAGMVASAAALWNVHIVESAFGHFIKGYTPLLKFLSVKLLVFFAYWQAPFLAFLRFVGILSMTEVQMKLLQASLMVSECLVCAGLHVFAWGPQEQWYAGVGEKTPLLDHKAEKNPFLA